MKNEFLHKFFSGQLMPALLRHPAPQFNERFARMVTGAGPFLPPDKCGGNHIQFICDVLKGVTGTAQVCEDPEPVDFVDIDDRHATSPAVTA